VRNATSRRDNERAHLKSREAGAQLATAMSKQRARGPGTGQRLVLLRLHAVVSSRTPKPGQTGGCPTPQRQGTCASTRAALLCASALALRLRLLPDEGLAQLFLTVCISQAA
jgi:hypothetical protein